MPTRAWLWFRFSITERRRVTPEQKKEIDGMSHYELCRAWRFAEVGDPLFADDTGKYFREVLFGKYGGFTPEISKRLGW